MPFEQRLLAGVLNFAYGSRLHLPAGAAEIALDPMARHAYALDAVVASILSAATLAAALLQVGNGSCCGRWFTTIQYPQQGISYAGVVVVSELRMPTFGL